MGSIKAIQTTYRGHRMRSRLEARFAVLFDWLELRWSYEPEGFDLGDAGNYLPDFWLPDLKIWVEIKPDLAPEEERKKFVALARGGGHDVFVFDHPDFEPPMFRSGGVLVGAWARKFGATARLNDYGAALEGDLGYWLAECMDCLSRNETTQTPGSVFVGLPNTDHWFLHVTTHGTLTELSGIGCRNTPRMNRAYEAARGARFEFGEKGGVSKRPRRRKSR